MTTVTADTTFQVDSSICPVYVASHIARHLGYLQQELGKVAAALRGLTEENRFSHYRHDLDWQFRDGGNIPAIWAKAEHADTVLLGTTFINQGGQIVVRADSGLNQVHQLRGRRIGLSKSLDERRVDWWRANSQRSIELALQLAGLTAADVHFVDFAYGPLATGSTAAPKGKLERTLTLPFTPEFGALQRGEVDAIYATQGRAEIYQSTGRFKVIEDLSRSPDWTVQLAATPYTLVASRRLVEERPEIVRAYLRANIKAARWAAEHRREAAELFHRETYDLRVEDVQRVLDDLDLTPSLSDFNLAALDEGKRFLLERGYIHNDFDTRQWANRQLLQDALDSL